MSLVNRIKQNLINIPGWRTNRKIIVFESDDWGSIRMPSKKVQYNLEKLGYIPKNDFYNRFDSLASEEDLSYLFETLSSVTDKNGNSAIITANTIVANPDFKNIEASNFQEYHYESFTDTLKKYTKHKNSFNLWKEGMNKNLFHPQFHGRDHVNITTWMNKLKANDVVTKTAFNSELLGLRDINNNNSRDYYFMRALDFIDINDLKIKVKAIEDGLKIFKNIFGYKSKSFIAPSYVWDENIEMVLKENRVDYIQGMRFQKIPKLGKELLQNKIHFLGNKNKYDQIYLVRNAFFEPTLTIKNQVVENALKRIEIAFKWNKPAIIGSHRLNYIGFINEKNRDVNLKLLKHLLNEIVIRWPEVEFMSSDKLGKLIKQ